MSTRTQHSALTIALIYTRVSSDEQAREGVSLDAQLMECRRYAARHGWLLGNEYQDIMAGTRDDRPRYQALLTEVQRLRADGQSLVVVVAALDRFGRKLLERVRCREALKALGVAVHGVRDGGEVSDLVANILASVAQEEVRRLGERISTAKQHIIRSGWYPPGSVSWGYRLRDATDAERSQGAPRRVLDVDPDTAPYVREMFQRLADGETVGKVAYWIARLPAVARGERSISKSTLFHTLRAPVYVARPHRGTEPVLERPVARWPALVDDATWARVQARMAGHQQMPHQASGRYLLTGLIRCPKCGTRMRGWTRRPARNRPAAPWFMCEGHRRGAHGTDPACRTTIDQGPVDAAVLAEVSAIVAAVAWNDASFQAELRRAWRLLQQPAADPAALSQRRRAQLERDVEQAKKRLTNAAVLLADGTIDKEGYELLRDKARADLEAATVELERLVGVAPTQTLPALDVVLREAGGWAAAVQALDVPALRDVLPVLIERVVPSRVRRGQYHVAITWTPVGKGLRELVSAVEATTAA